MNLKIYDNDMVIADIPLDQMQKEAIGFGRQGDCDVVIDYPGVSRVHGCIYLKNGAWYIQDMGSKNGLYFEGRQVADQRLEPGDRITIPESPGHSIDMVFYGIPGREQKESYSVSHHENSIAQFYSSAGGDRDVFGVQSNEPKANPQKEKKNTVKPAKTKNKPGAGLWVGIFAGLCAVSAIVVFLVFPIIGVGDKKRAGNATKAFGESVRTQYDDEDMWIDLAERVPDESYQVMYDELVAGVLPEDVKDGADLKADYIRHLKKEKIDRKKEKNKDKDDEDDKDDHEKDFSKKTTVELGEIEEAEDHDKAIKQLIKKETGDENDEEANKDYDKMLAVLENSKKCYTVELKVDAEDDDDDKDISDIAYKINSKWYSMYDFLNVQADLIDYYDSDAKSEDVSSAKMIKTAVEVSMGTEDAYIYLTAKQGYTVLRVDCDKTFEDKSEDSSKPGQSLEGYSSGGGGVTAVSAGGEFGQWKPDNMTPVEVLDLIAENIGEKTPKIKYQGEINDKTVDCYYVMITDKGSVFVGVGNSEEAPEKMTGEDTADNMIVLSPIPDEDYQ